MQVAFGRVRRRIALLQTIPQFRCDKTLVAIVGDPITSPSLGAPTSLIRFHSPQKSQT